MKEDDFKSGDRRDGGRPTNGRRDDARPTPNNAYRPRRDDRPDTSQRSNDRPAPRASNDNRQDRRSDDRPRPSFDRDRNAGSSAGRSDRSGTSRGNSTPGNRRDEYPRPKRDEYPRPKFDRSAGGDSFRGNNSAAPRRDSRPNDERPRFNRDAGRRDAGRQDAGRQDAGRSNTNQRDNDRPAPRFNRDNDRRDTGSQHTDRREFSPRNTERPASRFDRDTDRRSADRPDTDNRDTNQSGNRSEEPRQRSGENRFGQERRYEERPARSTDSRDSRPDNRESRDERPRSFDRSDRPTRENTSRSDDRPRSFDRSDRPSRENTSRDDDRPRSFDRPTRETPSRNDERPRSFDRSDRPTRRIDKPETDRDTDRTPDPDRSTFDLPQGSSEHRNDDSADKPERPSRARAESDERPAPRREERRSGPSSTERRVGKYDRAPNYDADALRKSVSPKRREEIERAEKHDNRNTGTDTIRLNRYIANAGICSRREADELIAQGTVQVNGKVVTEMGHKVQPGDVVKYGNRILNPEKMVYVLLNKPKDYITTTEDPEERRTVMELVADAGPFRIYPVGRLDRNTTGLMLMTNDGELAEKLTHPSNEIKKIYQVELDKPITDEHFEAIQAGVNLEDGTIKPDSLSIVTPDAQVVGIEIHSGRNRIVRRIFENFGYEVTKLDRTAYAGLSKKDLPRGTWRFLEPKEVVRLKYLQ